MIFNDLEQLKKLSPYVFSILVNFRADSFRDGRFEFNNNIYMNVATYFTKDINNSHFEAHKKHIDIQLMLSGSETILVSSTSLLKPISTYDEINDIIFFEKEIIYKKFVLNNNDFLVLMPDDAHIPCITINKSIKVRKAVIKLPIEKTGK